MNKDRAIPEGCMTVGELAKKMGTTVRTLQYYDKEGLFSPSSESEGGRRLYTDKDMVKLYQIMSLKSLGFSLGDIKDRLISLDTPADVASALSEHAAAIRENIKSLSASLSDIEALRFEVLQMQSVDFKKYADIITNLKMKNEYYWLIKHFDDSTLEYFRKKFDHDSGLAVMENVNRLLDRAIQLESDGVSPNSDEGMRFAKEFWDMIVEFTNGDMSMLPTLMQASSVQGPNEEWNKKQEAANGFIGQALDAYFTTLGYDPLGEGTK